MSTRLTTRLERPNLPPELEPLYDKSAQEVFDDWSHRPFAEVVQAFNACESAVYLDPTDGNRSVRYAVIKPEGDFDPDQTLVMPFTIGKGWTPQTFIMASIVHALVAPQGRLVAFPNNTLALIPALGRRLYGAWYSNAYAQAYTLTESEVLQVKAGDFTPIAERQYDAIKQLGINSIQLILARSQGAALGASLAKLAVQRDGLQLQATHLDEAPNTVEGRTANDLRRAAGRERRYIPIAYRDSGVPAYISAAMLDGKLVSWVSEAHFLAGSGFTQPNSAIREGFLMPTFFDDLTGVLAKNPCVAVSLSNARFSAVGNAARSQDFVDDQTASGCAAQFFEYSDLHAGGANPFVLGLLGKRALNWQKGAQQVKANQFPDSAS